MQSELVAQSLYLSVLAEGDGVVCPLQLHLKDVVELFRSREFHVFAVMVDEVFIVLLVVVADRVIVDVN